MAPRICERANRRQTKAALGGARGGAARMAGGTPQGNHRRNLQQAARELRGRRGRSAAASGCKVAVWQGGKYGAATVMQRVLLVLTFVLAASPVQIACGHEVRPGYLELRQSSTETWSVLWKVPAQGEMRLSIHPRFPEICARASEPIQFQVAGAFTERTTMT